MVSIVIAGIAVLIAAATLVLSITGVFYPKPLTDFKRDFDEFKDRYSDKHEELAREVSHIQGQLDILQHGHQRPRR